MDGKRVLITTTAAWQVIVGRLQSDEQRLSVNLGIRFYRESFPEQGKRISIHRDGGESVRFVVLANSKLTGFTAVSYFFTLTRDEPKLWPLAQRQEEDSRYSGSPSNGQARASKALVVMGLHSDDAVPVAPILTVRGLDCLVASCPPEPRRRKSICAIYKFSHELRTVAIDDAQDQIQNVTHFTFCLSADSNE